MKKKIVIAGGSGILGRKVSPLFLAHGFDVVVLSRSAHANIDGGRTVQWDGETEGKWQEELESATAIFNLSGARASAKMEKKNKREVITSRAKSTLIIGKAIQQCAHPPEVWVNAGAIQVYPSSTQDQTETSSIDTGDSFLALVSREWEAAFDAFSLPQTRKVLLRIGTVLGKEGFYAFLQKIVSSGISRIGPGTQHLSWIHEEDMARIMVEMVQNDFLSGTYNCTAPTPATYKEILKAISTHTGRRVWIPLPTWLIKGIFSAAKRNSAFLLNDRKVLPERLTQAGFSFSFPDIETAVKGL